MVCTRPLRYLILDLTSIGNPPTRCAIQIYRFIVHRTGKFEWRTLYMYKVTIFINDLLPRPPISSEDFCLIIVNITRHGWDCLKVFNPTAPRYCTEGNQNRIL